MDTTWLYTLTDLEFLLAQVVVILGIIVLEQWLKIRELRKTINFLLPIGRRRK